MTRLSRIIVASLLVSIAPAGAEDILWTKKKLYSNVDEELIIRDFFQDRRGGFFVDIGCSHAKKGSNTFFPEKHLGWSGIGVDGIPGYASDWATWRPRSKFLNFFVTDHSDTMDAFYWSVIWQLSTAKKDVAARRNVIEEIKVPTITLDDLLERNAVKEIDLLSIDVEGSHQEVLAGFSLNRWQPKLVCIEEEGMFAIPWFRERGYEPIERYRDRDIVNWYFAPKAEADAANSRQSPAGEKAMMERRAMLAAEPASSPIRTWYQPKVVLDPLGQPVRVAIPTVQPTQNAPNSRELP